MAPNENERKYLESIVIRRAVSDLRAVFSAVKNALNKLQSDTATIGDSVEVWMNLKENAQVVENANVKKMVEKRCQKALKNPAFLAANILDPRYRGSRLKPQQLKEATAYILELDNGVSDQMTIFLANDAPYNCAHLSVNNPGSWWKAGIIFGFCPALSNVARRLISGVPNSAGLERQFSTLRVTYGTLRNSLGVEKAGKLAFCFRSFHDKSK